MTKKALITGITGQDGSYLAENLLSKGYTVYGLRRTASTFNSGRINHIYEDPHNNDVNFYLLYGDLTDSSSVNQIIHEIEPDEIYHLGAQSHVRTSFDIPEYTANVTGLGSLRILEAIRRSKLNIKFYQASSSEMFGKVHETPQTEKTPFYPRSPYGCAKVFAYWTTINYRESYGLFNSNGILFNHESPRRGENFVTRKITKAIANIKAGKQKYLYLGNLEAKRDWGYAPDYVEAMRLMLQHKKPDDYVVATGETHTVREFLEEAFSYANLDWEKHVQIDKKYYRPTEVDSLLGDASKAKKQLGWSPKVTFKELTRIMVDADMKKEGISL